jgi:RNA recognition motif-containing protein
VVARESRMTTEDARKLFVAGLPDSINEEVLRQLFEATGSTVKEVSLPKDRTSGRARGFGFVTLETQEQAERARTALDGSIQAGKAISVRQFQGGSGRRDARTPEAPATSGPSSPVEDRTLYVGNLPYDATADEVEQLLTRCGVTPVLRVHLPVGPDGRPRGFGFVTLASADAVQQSLGALASADLRGRRVMVKVAHPRGSVQIQSPRAGGSPRAPNRTSPSEQPASSRFESPRDDANTDAAHRPPQPSGEFEEDEESIRAAGGRPRNDKKRKGAPAASKRKSGGSDEDRRRGGAASWQRWEDWDED